MARMFNFTPGVVRFASIFLIKSDTGKHARSDAGKPGAENQECVIKIVNKCLIVNTITIFLMYFCLSKFFTLFQLF